MTKWFKQAVINYSYSDYEGYSDRKELAALRKLLERADSFDEAVFTYNAAENSLCDCYDVLKGALAQGFPEDYVIDTDCYGNKYPKSKQVARCGNSVPPPFATALVKANWAERCIIFTGWKL